MDGAAPSSFFLVLAPETRGLEDLADSAGVEDLKGVLYKIIKACWQEKKEKMVSDGERCRNGYMVYSAPCISPACVDDCARIKAVRCGQGAMI